MLRSEKKQVVRDLEKVFAESGAVVVTRYKGLTVAEMSDLRSKLREKSAGYKVAKNRLVKLALKSQSLEEAEHLFTDQTGIAFSEDPVAAAKIVADFAKENDKLELVGGVMGDTVLDEAGIKNLATLPSLDEARAILIGTIQAPAVKVATVLREPAREIANILDQWREKQEAA